jgi:hypothetical protein
MSSDCQEATSAGRQVDGTPVNAKDRIWEGVMYLYGIDTMEAPEQYLHTEDDIRSAMAG